MTEPPSPGLPSAIERTSEDRLDSWKEIAAYMKRDVTTVQRWEKREGMPVHRHVHDKIGSVYAFRADLDAWTKGRSLGLVESVPDEPATETSPATPAPAPVPRRRLRVWSLTAGGAALAAVLTLWMLQLRDHAWVNPLEDARFLPLTDFAGTEQAAAISRDGRFVAFQADRDGRMDVWVTKIGSGEFRNLTRNAAWDIANPAVRAIGFSPDGTDVTFWARKLAGSNQPDINIWAAPIVGGEPRLYLEGAAEFDWSSDESRLVYHTPGAGDPMFVRNSGQSSAARHIFTAPDNLHSHFVLWSPDQAFIYFVQGSRGSVPDRMDIFRITSTGGSPERMTHHDALVSHPAFLNSRTLMYLAADPDGSGPRIHSLDIGRRASHRVSFGLDRYTSLSASADGRRLVTTLASPKGTLWRVPITDTPARTSDARPVSLTTGNGSSPRLGSDYLLYVSPKGASDTIWKLQAGLATEVWSAPEARIIGGPTIARDGRRIAFSIRQNSRALLYVVNADGTEARVITQALELQGAPAWTPDGQSITVAAVAEGVPRLFKVPLDGRPPVQFVADYSVDPVWSSDAELVVFSGADIGATFPVKAATGRGSAYPLNDLRLSRGARHLVFMPGRKSLVILRGDISHKNLWLIDLQTGTDRQLTDFASGFDVRDFDISADGRELVVEQVQEHSDIVLLEIPRR